MNKSRPIIDMDVKEFILTLWTGKSLQYRNKWLENKCKELWLKIVFSKKDNKLVVWIHQSYLVWRKIHNPLFVDDSFIPDNGNCLVNKEVYDEDDTRGNNISRLKTSKGYIMYYLRKPIKWFIFNLIKQNYGRI